MVTTTLVVMNRLLCLKCKRIDESIAIYFSYVICVLICIDDL